MLGFAELTFGTGIARPIERKHPASDVAMKRRIRPILNSADQAVLHRIDHAIFDVARVVGLIPDQVLPEPALPDAAFTAPDTDGA